MSNINNFKPETIPSSTLLGNNNQDIINNNENRSNMPSSDNKNNDNDNDNKNIKTYTNEILTNYDFNITLKDNATVLHIEITHKKFYWKKYMIIIPKYNESFSKNMYTNPNENINIFPKELSLSKIKEQIEKYIELKQIAISISGTKIDSKNEKEESVKLLKSTIKVILKFNFGHPSLNQTYDISLNGTFCFEKENLEEMKQNIYDDITSKSKNLEKLKANVNVKEKHFSGLVFELNTIIKKVFIYKTMNNDLEKEINC